MDYFTSVDGLLAERLPTDPVFCFRPHAARRAAEWFLNHFQGDVLYAVKANPEPVVLEALYAAGIRHFDVASPKELALVARFRDARFYNMNPVKHPRHIAESYFEYGVRDFAVDCLDELEKIKRMTGNARDLNIYVRLALANHSSMLPLEHKFGVPMDQAAELLVAARLASAKLGVCFHVGSQTMDPEAYRAAIHQANQAIIQAGVVVDYLDVGGGFPSAYPGMEAPPLEQYMATIHHAFEESMTSENARLLCEPGRALCAEAASLLVSVTLRKDNRLYITEGAYGALFDAAHLRFPFPVRMIRPTGEASRRMTAFMFYGPTCDSIDTISGPFLLPEDIGEGDYIEIGMLGAYGKNLRTAFNGFHDGEDVIVGDEPLQSMYRPAAVCLPEMPRPAAASGESGQRPENIIALDM
ncbi:type III PLP-dependent enzyme [Luteithermobacter gelatinilyticus]|uniref:type III PLP-dependent enzyme n=1 Tax=Luteithermobacter gelatinilyticus TaxID=2582913 RepID=UPI0011065AED|nr:type III PLP-dependent enzyme [Luteithermobacter gelatinilyticus]